MLSILLSLTLGFSAIDQEKLPAAHVETIARDVIEQLQIDMRVKPSLIVTERPEPTPLGAMLYANGKCVIIINTQKNAWAQWGRFLDGQNTSNWDGIVAASVAHEMGHCLRESREFVASFSLENKQFRGLQQVSNTGLPADMVFKQELFADAVAVLYAQETLAEQASEVIETMIQARSKYGANDPTHNTAEVLKKLLSKPMLRDDHETLGQAAKRMLETL
ncbi:hypothetical protein [Limnobacter sp.]|uniref:hypothetical protein n=1 Tax=Limnobacter sp. TaxID=2003368 RepID=UPI0035174BB6